MLGNIISLCSSAALIIIVLKTIGKCSDIALSLGLGSEATYIRYDGSCIKTPRPTGFSENGCKPDCLKSSSVGYTSMSS